MWGYAQESTRAKGVEISYRAVVVLDVSPADVLVALVAVDENKVIAIGDAARVVPPTGEIKGVRGVYLSLND